jgi:hypothetical protein
VQEGLLVARCKIYEIQGPDPSRTAGALRCHRDAVSNVEVDAPPPVPVCDHHRSVKWSLFRGSDGWTYAVDVDAQPRTRTSR